MIVSNGTTLDFAPQALGETTPTLSNGYFYAAQGLDLSGKFATYAALYKAQPSVATLVDKVSAAAARLTVKVWDDTPKTGRVQDKTSDFARLMANPCTFMSPFSFYRWTVSTYEIYGESFWYKVRDPNGPSAETEYGTRLTGKVISLLPMHPSRTAVHRNSFGMVEYIFTLGVASAGILHAPAEDVVAFLRYNPESLMRGLSRLEPLRTTLLNEDAARRATQSFWAKGARPSVFLKHPGELSQPAQDRLKASFDARHAGADNAGGTAILEEGMDAVVVQLTMEEMQYIESRKINMQEACMVYDVPPPVVHILDHATFSNITEQMRSMYRDTMTPRFEDWESTIDFSLRAEFFAIDERSAEFDMTDVLRGDFETRADKAVTLRNSGIYTGNESREIVGIALSTDPEMDRLYANAALVPLGTPAQRVTITEAATPSPAMQSEANDAAAGASGAAAVAATADTVAGKPGGKSVRRGGRPIGKKSTTKDIRAARVAAHKAELTKFFARQRASVKAAVTKKAAGVFDPGAWDGDLAKILHTLSVATAQAIGAKVAEDLGGEYDGADIADYLLKNAALSAKNINATTADDIAAAFESDTASEDPEATVDGLFDGEISARTDEISATGVSIIGGLAALMGARQGGAKTKTWVVTSSNPRPTHAEVDGETVPLNTEFSNGSNGPGDPSGGASEVAGCTCDLIFSSEEG